MIKSPPRPIDSLITVIFCISLLGLTHTFVTYGQCLHDAAVTSDSSAVDQTDVINAMTARIAEESFWSGIQLPTQILHAIVFHAQNMGGSRPFDFDVLVIVPDINATYQYRICGNRIIPVKRTEEWLTWRYPGHTRVSGDEYARHQVAQFDTFISHAKRSEATLTIALASDALFRVDAKLKAIRLAQIERATRELFHKRPLRLEVANFSGTTEQINALAPALGEMVTFSVAYSCAARDRVEVGREIPLKSVRSDLRARIETNSTTLTIK